MTEDTPTDHQACYTNEGLGETSSLEATEMTKLVRVLLASDLPSTDQPNSLAQEPRDHPSCKDLIYSLCVGIHVLDMFMYVCPCMHVGTQRSTSDFVSLELSCFSLFCFRDRVSHWPRPCRLGWGPRIPLIPISKN